jgi:hypothetical protein
MENEELELKDNQCIVLFRCTDAKECPCVYKVNKRKCKNRTDYYCKSAVAQVQAMVRYAKRIGLEITAKGFDKCML